MAHIRPEVYKGVEANSIDDVVFQDPFQDEARKAKRNLVASSFGALLIASLELKISGFLGLQTVTGAAIGALITQGLACLIVVYFLAGFALSVYVDYAAWKFKRERYFIKPYLALVSMLEAHFHVTGEQMSNATACLEGLTFERGMPEEIEFQKAIRDSVGQVKSIQQEAQSLYAEIRPLLAHWSGVVRRSNRLAWRLRARLVSLWLLDIIVPVGLAGVAIWRTYEGIPIVISKVAG